MSIAFVHLGWILWLITPSAIKLLVWIGVCGCGWPISASICCKYAALFAFKYRAPSSAPDSINETQKGHMKKQCQGVRSTKFKENTQSEDENLLGNTVAEVDPCPPQKMRDIFIKIYNTGKMLSNQTECFPAMSSKGNQ
jgi:hypothetical protein